MCGCLKEESRTFVDGNRLVTRWVLSASEGNREREIVKRWGLMWLSVMRYGRCDFIFRTQGPRTIGFIGFEWVDLFKYSTSMKYGA